MIKVSAIVSTYNSSRFIRGCLDDLLAQSLWQRGELEIVVINSGSQQDEAYHLKQYLKQGIPLTIITTLREPLYVAWNRGLRIAQGEYVTNANTDDRHHPLAYEQMATALDNNPSIGLVYADAFVTPTPNATWDSPYDLNDQPPYPNGVLGWPEFDPLLLLQYCYIGQAPMWRKSLHTQVGFFDESFMVAGDYELWLRMVACGVPMQRLPQILGLFYWHPDQLGRRQAQQSAMESRRAIWRHRKAIEKQWQPSPT